MSEYNSEFDAETRVTDAGETLFNRGCVVCGDGLWVPGGVNGPMCENCGEDYEFGDDEADE